MSASGLALEEEVSTSTVSRCRLKWWEKDGGRTVELVGPIQREEMERAISESGQSSRKESASPPQKRMMSRQVGHVRRAEYKADRRLPQSAPCGPVCCIRPWRAQRSAMNYPAHGRFDAYDPAVVADAIRALGYSDASVVRFVDGERVGGPVLRQMPWLRSGRIWQRLGECLSHRHVHVQVSEGAGSVGATAVAIPTRREDIDTWLMFRQGPTAFRWAPGVCPIDAPCPRWGR